MLTANISSRRLTEGCDVSFFTPSDANRSPDAPGLRKTNVSSETESYYLNQPKREVRGIYFCPKLTGAVGDVDEEKVSGVAFCVFFTQRWEVGRGTRKKG